MFASGVTLLATVAAVLLAGLFAMRRRPVLALLCLICFFALFRPGVAVASEICRPTRYADGDTFTFFRAGEKVRVRLAGYDAPERGQPYSRVATLRLRLLTQGGAACDCYKQDKHGRSVCTVRTLSGENVAHVMLRAGLACIDARFEREAAPVDRQAAREALQAAQARRTGMWSLTNPQCAADFRRGKMPSDKKMREILEEPALSDWLRSAMKSALDRDPVDAANDAAVLSLVLNHRANNIASEVLAALAVLKAKEGPVQG